MKSEDTPSSVAKELEKEEFVKVHATKISDQSIRDPKKLAERKRERANARTGRISNAKGNEKKRSKGSRKGGTKGKARR